jgi:hypothetical protein
MQTDESRLRFALQFAERDLGSLRPGDWLNLREDLQQFLRLWSTPVRHAAEDGSVSATVAHLSEGPDPQHMTEAELCALQAQVRPHLKPPATGAPLATFFPVRVEVALTANGVHIQGTAAALFLEHVRFLLEKLPPRRVVLCTECGEPFYARKSQQYCSRVCANRVAQRRFRERHEAEATPGS